MCYVIAFQTSYRLTCISLSLPPILFHRFVKACTLPDEDLKEKRGYGIVAR